MDYAQENRAANGIGMSQHDQALPSKGFTLAGMPPVPPSPLQQLTNQFTRTDRLIDEINGQLARIREGDQPQPSADRVGLTAGIDFNPQRGLPELAISAEISANRLEDVLAQLRSF